MISTCAWTNSCLRATQIPHSPLHCDEALRIRVSELTGASTHLNTQACEWVMGAMATLLSLLLPQEKEILKLALSLTEPVKMSMAWKQEK